MDVEANGQRAIAGKPVVVIGIEMRLDPIPRAPRTEFAAWLYIRKLGRPSIDDNIQMFWHHDAVPADRDLQDLTPLKVTITYRVV